MRTFYLLLFAIFCGITSHAQQLMINEISQGTAAKEYVEFVVVGTPSCLSPAPTSDLRGIVIDDNNGDFQTGSGTGIAIGAVRFANIPFWSAIPQGTLILIYNESDINPAIPPIDQSMTDGNCRLILPINSNLLEGQAVSPTTSSTTYPGTASWIAGGGTWSQVAMANTNDSFQIRQSSTSLSATHVVSWGNNTLNNQIYFPSATGAVFSMMNTSDNNPTNQANWSNGAVGSNETPGAPNNTANDAWIGSMNPQCGISSGLNLSLSSTVTGCGIPCTGSATVNITGGTGPYTILWSNGGTSSTINGLCVGTYTVDVTDAGGCTATDQVVVSFASNSLNVMLNVSDESCSALCDGIVTTTVIGGTTPYTFSWTNGATTANLFNLCPNVYTVTVSDPNGCVGTATTSIQPGTPIPDATISAAGPFTIFDAPQQLQAASSGGVWSSDCGTCLNTSTGVFNPQISGEGTFQVCYATGSGACTDTDCISITVNFDCTTIENSANLSLCPDSTINFNGTLLTQSGSYSQTFIAQNGCDSIFTLNLSYFNQTVSNVTQYICEGDSVLINGTWINQADLIVNPLIDANGCPYNQEITVLVDDCIIEDLTVFVPNVITVNGDGVNDIFEILINEGTLADGFIVNRWGNIIKEFSVDNLTWDGKDKNGYVVQDGVYTYVLTVKKNVNDYVERVVGFVTVLK
jgi:gliding motility-associated-like protein